MVQAKDLVDQLLRIPTVHIHNKAVVIDKLTTILQDGPSQLHFISDFDMTMSRHWIRNKVTDALERNSSSHGIPARYDKMTPEYKQETARIYNKYYPIEINQNMTHDEKVPYMIQWWTEAHESIIKQRISKKDIEAMTEQVKLELRPGVDQVLTECQKASIPFLVFSAGIGNIIEVILKRVDLYFDNMHIVSNMMIFDEQDICIGFKDPLIHVFNKSEFQLETSPYHKLIEQRTNVILMGDSLGDLQMSQGVDHTICLTIGFLNHDFNSLRDSYLNAFDIVIEGDANMQPVIELLQSFNK
ncbi:Putative Pyrimidine 5'-nucleotidase (UMPH-1) [Rhizopus microsporus]|nr:Putative Pyrimidine 5'-nucleotidase (UMPH-1) [Rhizopus microsporus]